MICCYCCVMSVWVVSMFCLWGSARGMVLRLIHFRFFFLLSLEFRYYYWFSRECTIIHTGVRVAKELQGWLILHWRYEKVETRCTKIICTELQVILCKQGYTDSFFQCGIETRSSILGRRIKCHIGAALQLEIQIVYGYTLLLCLSIKLRFNVFHGCTLFL